jgi:hypothetical protein
MSRGKSPKKVIFIVLFGLVCAGVLGWLFYLNASVDRSLPDNVAQASGPNSNMWAQAVGADRNSATPATARPLKTTLATVQPGDKTLSTDDGTAPTPDDQSVDWHSIDPNTENAIKILMGNDSRGSDISRVLPLPAQFQPGLYNPLGPPSINLDTFRYFLKEGNSPALPEAASMYNACLKLYCDPAVALAFFQHESSMGHYGAAADNKSLGNIRCVPPAPCRTTSGNGSFKVYATWTDGLIDWAILMRETYATKWRLFSLEQIIPRYAPSSDNNDPNGYINTVKKLVNKYRSYRPQQ